METPAFFSMPTIQGKYFDGISTRPFNTIITTHERDALIAFTAPNGSFTQWRIHDVEYENYGSYLEIRHKNDRNQFIQIDDKAYVTLFFKLLKDANQLSVYQRLINLGIKGAVAITLFLLIIVGLGYFVALPWAAEKAVELIPETYDKTLGDVFSNTYYEQHQVDSVKTDLMNQFASCFEWNNSTELQFVVVKSDILNAFALPNGHIVIFTGLLDKMKNYEELVGLIGHEVGHINNRHSIKTLTRNLAGYLFISVIFTDVNAAMAIIAENVENLQSLTYSRRFEYEADEVGTKLIIQNNVDPRGMLQLFERLQDDTKFTLPVFMSTHPYTKDRISNISRLIEEETYQVQHQPKAEQLFIELESI